MIHDSRLKPNLLGPLSGGRHFAYWFIKDGGLCFIEMTREEIGQYSKSNQNWVYVSPTRFLAYGTSTEDLTIEGLE